MGKTRQEKKNLKKQKRQENKRVSQEQKTLYENESLDCEEQKEEKVLEQENSNSFDWHKAFGTKKRNDCPPKDKVQSYNRSSHIDEDMEKHLDKCMECVNE